MVAPFFVWFAKILKKNPTNVFLFGKCDLTLHQQLKKRHGFNLPYHFNAHYHCGDVCVALH